MSTESPGARGAQAPGAAPVTRAELDQALAVMASVDERLDALHKGVRQLRSRIRRNRKRADATGEDFQRLAPQVASLESRLESLRQRLDGPVTGTEAEVAAARRVLDEVRREHEQIRVRFAGMAAYEARLGRLERRAGQGGKEGALQRLRRRARRLRGS